MNSIVIFVKYPAPGKVKTRLGAQIGYRLAADLYHLFIDQTLEIARRAEADNIYIAYEPKERSDDFEKLVPDGFNCFPQHGQDLGQRMLNAFEYVLNQNSNKVIILGSDSPTLPVHIVKDAFTRLAAFDLVLGPAEDGGYYLIGVKRPYQGIFDNIEWSSPSVLQNTLERASELGIHYSLLPQWYDVDTLADLRRAVQDDSSKKIKSYLQKHPEILSA
jgi:rSAM/selenodomain-associated transferase 1